MQILKNTLEKSIILEHSSKKNNFLTKFNFLISRFRIVFIKVIKSTEKLIIICALIVQDKLFRLLSSSRKFKFPYKKKNKLS